MRWPQLGFLLFEAEDDFVTKFNPCLLSLLNSRADPSVFYSNASIMIIRSQAVLVAVENEVVKMNS